MPVEVEARTLPALLTASEPGPSPDWLKAAADALRVASRFEQLHACLTIPAPPRRALKQSARGAHAAGRETASGDAAGPELRASVAALGARGVVNEGPRWELRIAPVPCGSRAGSGAPAKTTGGVPK